MDPAVWQNILYIAVGGVFTILWQLIKWVRGGRGDRISEMEQGVAANDKALDDLREDVNKNMVRHPDLEAVERRLEERMDRGRRHTHERIDRLEANLESRLDLMAEDTGKQIQTVLDAVKAMNQIRSTQEQSARDASND
jgi:hypothetical protein